MNAFPNPDYENLPQYQDLWRKVDDEMRMEALGRFLKPFHKRYRSHLGAPKLNYDVRIDEGDDVLGQLQRDGCALTRTDPALKATLVELATPLAQVLHARLDEHPKPRITDFQQVLNRSEHGPIFSAVQQILSAGHIDAVATAYAGGPLFLKHLAIQVNTERATAATYPVIDEAGLPEPRTRYFHIDSAMWPPLKVLIYLNRVTLDEGPFRYVAGSHRLASAFELMVRKTNDKEQIHDEMFLALPPPFRMTTHFGDEIDPDSEAATELLRRERVCCDGESDLILFDFNGAHRGGFVRRGHRYMMQCIFAPAD